MKSIKFVMLLAFVLSAKTQYGQWSEYLNIVKDLPAVFQTWILKVESIADAQDRDHLTDMGNKLYLRLDKIILEKRRLINEIESAPNPSSIRFGNLGERVEQLQQLLKDYEDVTTKVGMETVKISNLIALDLNDKIRILGESGNAISKEEGLRRLKLGIDKLEEAKLKVEQFAKILEDKAKRENENR